jgi:hypothetical protein
MKKGGENGRTLERHDDIETFCFSSFLEAFLSTAGFENGD